MRKLLLTLLLAACMVPAAAQNNSYSYSASRQRPRVRFEWGALGGVNVADFNTSMRGVEIKNKLGWQAGIVSAIDFGAYAIEPQMLYVRQGMRIRDNAGKELDLKSNSVDVPVLLSLRMLKPLRIYAGPVFTVMNDCKEKSGGDLLDFGRVRPTLSYTVGIGVALRHILLDLRYNGQFKGKEDVVLPNGAKINRLTSYNVALSVGYIF